MERNVANKNMQRDIIGITCTVFEMMTGEFFNRSNHNLHSLTLLIAGKLKVKSNKQLKTLIPKLKPFSDDLIDFLMMLLEERSIDDEPICFQKILKHKFLNPKVESDLYEEHFLQELV
jgi:hypothetical protein